MTLALNFIYYRNFRFDGKLHIRCTGADLHKVDRIRYEYERTGSEGPVSFRGVSVHSQARSGKLADHGCPATLVADDEPGTYTIRPKVVLLDEHAAALGRATGWAGVIEMPPLVLDIKADEPNRSLLDKIPLPANARRKRASGHDDAVPTPVWPAPVPGSRYPTLLIRFGAGGHERLLHDLQPGSGALLARRWPGLQAVIAPTPLLSGGELSEARLRPLRQYCYLEQPASMLNDTYAALLKDLAALEYVHAMEFVQPEPEPHPVALVLAGLLATLLTGAAVVAGNKAYEDAQPTPDFEPRQNYLDQPGPRGQGLNVRRAWAKQVTGKGARIHFCDGGLYPQHEDLRGNPALKIVSLEPNHNPSHGTASAGIIVATRNDMGVTGISHDSELYLYNNRAMDAQRQFQALKDLLRNVEPGDIVGINRQTANSEVLSSLLPSLHDKAWWTVMQQLSERGAVVVNAAANGSSATLADKGTRAGQGLDLSQWRYFDDHGDSGTILVGACQSWDGKPHAYSNHHYPYRMLNAWGDSVVTLSRGDLQDLGGDDRDYSANYAGTSSATPMVVGALGLIQSYAMEHHHIYLNGNQMHQLVMVSGYDDATLEGTDVLPMGARPNVHGALVLLDRILGGGRFEA